MLNVDLLMSHNFKLLSALPVKMFFPPPAKQQQLILLL